MEFSSSARIAVQRQELRSGFDSYRRWKLLLVHSHPYLGILGRGLLWTLVTVAARLSLPWALAALVLVDADASIGDGGAAPWAFVFLALMALTGYGDYRLRVGLARFAVGWARNLRRSGIEKVRNWPRRARSAQSGDLVARLIADVARFKATLKAFLIYVLANMLLLAAASVVLATQSLALGAVFGVGVLCALCLAAYGGRINLGTVLRQRVREGELAALIVDAREHNGLMSEFADLDRESAHWEIRETRDTGRTTWMAHALMALVAVLTLGSSLAAAAEGRVNPELPAVLVGYVFLLTRPLIRLTRQGARAGKLLACASRLVDMLAEEPSGYGKLAPLRHSLHVHWSVAGSSARGHLTVYAGERLLWIAPPAGIRRGLAALTGRTQAEVVWDDESIAALPGGFPKERLCAVGAGSSWRLGEVRELLLDEHGKPLDHGLLIALDIVAHVVDLRAPSSLSRGEHLRVALALALARRPDVLLVWDPAGALEAPGIWGALRLRQAGRALVHAHSTPLDSGAYDRVLRLDENGVASDGDPLEGYAVRPVARERPT